jgi:hypothetical protein
MEAIRCTELKQYTVAMDSQQTGNPWRLGCRQGLFFQPSKPPIQGVSIDPRLAVITTTIAPMRESWLSLFMAALVSLQIVSRGV